LLVSKEHAPSGTKETDRSARRVGIGHDTVRPGGHSRTVVALHLLADVAVNVSPGRLSAPTIERGVQDRSGIRRQALIVVLIELPLDIGLDIGQVGWIS